MVTTVEGWGRSYWGHRGGGGCSSYPRWMTRFGCSACGLELIGPVRPLNHPGGVDLEMQHDLIPRGHYLSVVQFKVWHPDWIWSFGEDELIFNLDDVRSICQGGVLAGCCGLDGQDGINTYCLNDHAIGTECSDCWTPRMLHIPAHHLRIELD
jgi:hypothetical protein